MRQTGGLAAETASWPGLQSNVGGNSFPSVASGQALASCTGLGASGRVVFCRNQFREEQGGKRGTALQCFCLISSLSGCEDMREFVGQAWRNICKELWHLWHYIVWPGEEGMSSAVKIE